MAVDTTVTRLLHIRTPIIAAPMAGPSGGELAAQVSRAGGFGFMAAGMFSRTFITPHGTFKGYDSSEAFEEELQLASSILRAKSGSTEAGRTLQIGVGFLGWTLDQDSKRAEKFLSMVLEARVAAIWFAFGSDLGKWVNVVRNSDANKSESHKTTIFILVNSLQEARKSVLEWDADVLVAQGNEAGGHGHGAAPPLLALVPEILNGFSAEKDGKSCPPVIAAGGVTTGSQIAALLTLGASGVALGTRFLLTPEAHYTDAQKAALIAADGTSTVRTMAFDVMRGTLGWPAGINGRALNNNTVERFERGEDVEDLRQSFQKATLEQDVNGMLVWAGTGVGLVNEMKPAADVLAQLHKEMVQDLKRAASLVDGIALPDTILREFVESF